MRVDHEKRAMRKDGVRVKHEKKRAVVRDHHKKEQWGESSP